jgi:hypothetical protein
LGGGKIVNRLFKPLPSTTFKVAQLVIINFKKDQNYLLNFSFLLNNSKSVEGKNSDIF